MLIVWNAVEPKDEKAAFEDRADKFALVYMYQGIPEDILLSLADKETTKEALEAIKTMCLGADRVNKVRVQTLKAEFESLCMKETYQLDNFYMKLNGLVTNRRALGEEIEESYVVKKLFCAVPSKFLQITSTIEQFEHLEEMSMEEAVGSLKAHEEGMKGTTEHNGGQLLLTEEEWQKRESVEGKLLFTKEEWIKRNSRGGTDVYSGQRNRGDSRGRDIGCGQSQNKML